MNWYNQVPYIRKTLESIFDKSFCIQPGQTIMIEFIDVPYELILFIVDFGTKRKINVIYNTKHQEIINSNAVYLDETYYHKLARIELAQMKEADFFLGIRAIENTLDFGYIPMDKKLMILKNYIRPVHFNYRNNNIPWLYFRLPTPGMAQNASMESHAFMEYYYSSLLIDYELLKTRLEPLKMMMSQTEKVRIINHNTDLQFNINDMPIIIDVGEHNLPDGEVRTAPQLKSVEGIITFNISSTYYGHPFNTISLDFKEGKIIDARSDKNQDSLEKLLDTDKGAKYIGEFAIGVNPKINRTVNDILFDEKLLGSIHMAIGNAYPECDNGNRSSIHWDLILKTVDSKLFFDDTIIIENEKFIPKELCHLNTK